VSTPFRFFGYFILFFLQIVWFCLFDVKYYSYQCFFFVLLYYLIKHQGHWTIIAIEPRRAIVMEGNANSSMEVTNPQNQFG
jgi:D-alanyl-lipoteichoic acid acyltransferase DltB (MBOAT superfamily)